MAALFSLGRVVATPGALQLLGAAGIDARQLLARHQSGDWGIVDAADRRENDFSVHRRLRILSSYPAGDGRIWVITEADRSSTTLLLPEEY